MPVSDIVFQGINRAASDYSNAGACEELINLRPTGTGLVPVKPFSVKMAGVTYDKLYIHNAGAITNYIAVKLDGGTLYFYWVSEQGEDLATLAEISVAGKTHFSVDQVHFAYTGNIVLFSISDEEDDLYKNLYFLWDGSEYQSKYADIPRTTFRLYTDTSGADLGIVDGSVSLGTEYDQIEAVKKTIDIATGKHKEGCFGYFIAALAFKTKDGNVLLTDNWTFYSPISTIIYSQEHSQVHTEWIDASGHYKNILLYSGEECWGTLLGTKVKARVSLSGSWNEDTSVIESVEVYASKPVPYVVPDTVQHNDGDTTSSRRMVDILGYDKAGLDNQLLYLQKTIPVKEIINKSEPYEFELEFGGAIQATGKTLEVDAGDVTRYGSLLAYNARFHLFKSTKKVNISMPSFAFYGSGIPHYVFVVYNDGRKDITVYVGTESIRGDGANIVIAPFTNIKRVITQRLQSGALYVTRQYEMAESQRYNYSICTDGGTAYTRSFITGVLSETIFIDEPDAINVTEQYNPFVFKVEHSYLAPGAVLDVQPQMVAVKDVTYGDYPLNVFTNRGLYALLQGNGTVLYGNFRSISNLISTGNAVPTEMGTFFLAAGNLWLVSGDNAVLISDALNPGPHKFIRDSAGYRAISAGQYDVTTILSQVPFDEYVAGATLAYNRYRDELFVSNTDYNYTYVLSLKYRQWFKMSLKLSQDVVGSDIATVPLGTAKNIVDFTEELETVGDAPVSVLVHYQTRPFSIGYQYIHVHRLLSMIRANLSTDDLLIVGLYGSDNLQDWNLLSYASRSGIKISQIRTPSAARSWRYYTVCVGGLCPWDTDFGNTLFEYQPVTRRIG